MYRGFFRALLETSFPVDGLGVWSASKKSFGLIFQGLFVGVFGLSGIGESLRLESILLRIYLFMCIGY